MLTLLKAILLHLKGIQSARLIPLEHEDMLIKEVEAKIALLETYPFDPPPKKA